MARQNIQLETHAQRVVDGHVLYFYVVVVKEKRTMMESQAAPSGRGKPYAQELRDLAGP
ncbi:hypothetical protein NKDENANG_03673 [Candidatus Entotheonellaceae bacterium PAL068K]